MEFVKFLEVFWAIVKEEGKDILDSPSRLLDMLVDSGADDDKFIAEVKGALAVNAHKELWDACFGDLEEKKSHLMASLMNKYFWYSEMAKEAVEMIAFVVFLSVMMECHVAYDDVEQNEWNSLGVEFSSENYGHKNYDIAVACFRKAGKMGCTLGLINLGLCYEKGEGVEKDPGHALDLYQEAADQKDGFALSILGQCYEYGRCVEPDIKKAADFYREAVLANDTGAMYLLGLCYKDGKGVEQNIYQAVDLFRDAAGRELPIAQYQYGLCLENGEGVVQNYEEAVDYYQRAVGKNLAQAKYRLGLCYENGRGIEQNFDKARDLYQEAAEQELPDAQYRMGLCYENGEGVEKDPVHAVELYRAAAEEEHEQAIEALKRLGEFESQE